MNYAAAGWVHLLQSVRAKKWWFIVLIILQMIIIASFVYVALIYQLKILQSAQGLLQPLENANFDSNSLQAGQPFLSDSLKLYQSYRGLIDAITMMAALLAGLFLTGNGAIWILSHYIVEGKKVSWKERLKTIVFQWLKYGALTIIVYGVLGVASYFLLKRLIVQQVEVGSFGVVVQAVIYCSLLFYFLLATGFAVISAQSWRDFVKRFSTVAFKKIHKTFLIFIVNLVVFGVLLFLIYRSMEYFENFPLALFFAVIFIIVIVIARLWWISSLQIVAGSHPKTEPHETHHH